MCATWINRNFLLQIINKYKTKYFPFLSSLFFVFAIIFQIDLKTHNQLEHYNFHLLKRKEDFFFTTASNQLSANTFLSALDLTNYKNLILGIYQLPPVPEAAEYEISDNTSSSSTLHEDLQTDYQIEHGRVSSSGVNKKKFYQAPSTMVSSIQHVRQASVNDEQSACYTDQASRKYGCVSTENEMSVSLLLFFQT